MDDSIGAFFAMGGYAAYVWPAFALAFAVLFGLLIASLRTLRTNRAALAALQAAGGGRRRHEPTTAATTAGGADSNGAGHEA